MTLSVRVVLSSITVGVFLTSWIAGFAAALGVEVDWEVAGVFCAGCLDETTAGFVDFTELVFAGCAVPGSGLVTGFDFCAQLTETTRERQYERKNDFVFINEC